MTIDDVVKTLDEWAPSLLQEDYDNAGLIIGNREADCSKILICLDCVEETIDEAIEAGCNLVIAHHPLIFRGLKSITGSNYLEKTIIKAIRHEIAVYAIHTNLDNILWGVNNEISQRIGLINNKILRPSQGKLRKLVTFVPLDHVKPVSEAVFNAGAGKIGNYDHCSFSLNGTGTFRPLPDANPFSGELGKISHEEETRLEVNFPVWKEKAVLKALRRAHPYEEIAYYIQSLENTHQEVGSGLIGELKQETAFEDFLQLIKNTFGGMLRYTNPIKKNIKKVSVCGGSGSFLLQDAINQQADVFLSSDFKYHQFFDADGKITIVDIGHYESEQFTINLIGRYINEKFPNFAVLFTKIKTNPVQYL